MSENKKKIAWLLQISIKFLLRKNQFFRAVGKLTIKMFSVEAMNYHVHIWLQLNPLCRKLLILYDARYIPGIHSRNQTEAECLNEDVEIPSIISFPKAFNQRAEINLVETFYGK